MLLLTTVFTMVFHSSISFITESFYFVFFDFAAAVRRCWGKQTKSCVDLQPKKKTDSKPKKVKIHPFPSWFIIVVQYTSLSLSLSLSSFFRPSSNIPWNWTNKPVLHWLPAWHSPVAWTLRWCRLLLLFWLRTNSILGQHEKYVTCSLRDDTILLYSSSQNNVLLSLDCCFSILFLFLAVVIIAGPSFRMQSIKSNNPIRINPPQ